MLAHLLSSSTPPDHWPRQWKYLAPFSGRGCKRKECFVFTHPCGGGDFLSFLPTPAVGGFFVVFPPYGGDKRGSLHLPPLNCRCPLSKPIIIKHNSSKNVPDTFNYPKILIDLYVLHQGPKNFSELYY